jgi:SAM-dependent methyltransferase
MQQHLENEKSTDRYKASSFKAYNFELPQHYDNSMAVKFFRVSVMDDFVLDELRFQIGNLAILDVGCATGRLLDRLASNGARKLAGSDLAPRILDVARSKLAGRGVDVDLRCADAEGSLPWSSSSFDVVTLTGVLHHFYRPEAALAEIFRVLCTGGRLVMVDPCWFPPIREFVNLCLRVHPHQGDYHFYTSQQSKRMLVDMGCKVVRCERLNWFFYGIVAVKGKTTKPN